MASSLATAGSSRHAPVSARSRSASCVASIEGGVASAAGAAAATSSAALPGSDSARSKVSTSPSTLSPTCEAVASGVVSTSVSIALASAAEMFLSVSLVLEVSLVDPTLSVPLDSPMLATMITSFQSAARAALGRG